MDEDPIVLSHLRIELINMLTGILGARLSWRESILSDRTCHGQRPGETL
jgi:hypothetical protein